MITVWKPWGDGMKNCPKCKAELLDNARFCPYCMTQLDEKTSVNKHANKKATPIVLTVGAVLLVFAIILLVILLSGRPDPDRDQGSDFDRDSVSVGQSSIKDDGSRSSHGNPQSGTSQSFDGASSEQNNQQNSYQNTSSENQLTSEIDGTGSADTSTSANFGSANSSQSSSEQSSVVSSSPVVSSSASSKQQSSSSQSSATSSTKPETTELNYTYRNAVAGDDCNGYADVSNCVVITGVKNPRSDGVYEIPNTIEGKKVLTVATEAFKADNIKLTVKKVIFPENVRNLGLSCLFYCNNLTDVYFKGEAVHIGDGCWPPKQRRTSTITLHSSATAHNRNFTKLSMIAYYNDLEFEEWNG